jgi:Ca2+-binding EF-hand superfamily protein
MKFMVQNVTNGQQKTKLMKVFQAMDVDGNGQLSKEELIAGS